MKEWTFDTAKELIIDILMEETNEEELTEAKCVELATKIAKALEDAE